MVLINYTNKMQILNKGIHNHMLQKYIETKIFPSNNHTQNDNKQFPFKYIFYIVGLSILAITSYYYLSAK